MSHPGSTSTILLLSLPPTLLCGINLLSFTTSPQFLGIKDLPPGYHFIYTSETSSLSLRDGFWIHIPKSTPPSLIIRKWDPGETCLVPVVSGEEEDSCRAWLPEIWTERLTPYRQDSGGGGDGGIDEGGRDDDDILEKNDWPALTSHITSPLLSRLTNNADWRINSASCAEQDADHIPGLSAAEAEFGERELVFLGIDLKRTWRQGAVGRERTEAAVDRSWALEDVEERWKVEGKGDVILGQMQVCFLMVMTVANYSCLEEWKRILGLVLTCKRAVRASEEWFAEFLGLLRRQLGRGGDVDGGLFDMSDDGGAYLKGLLKGFKRTLGQVFGDGEGEDVKEEWDELEQWLKGEYGWELGDSFVRRGMLELEDGEQVEVEMEEMEAEDERGEYAPVVVEL